MTEVGEVCREIDIQREVVAFLQERDCIVFRMNAGRAKKNVSMAPAGTPDLLVLTPRGRTYWMEIKTPTGKVSHTQEKFHLELIQRNQNVIVITNVKDLESIWGQA